MKLQCVAVIAPFLILFGCKGKIIADQSDTDAAESKNIVDLDSTITANEEELDISVKLERPIMDALGYANQRDGANLIYGGDSIVRDPVNDRVTVSGHAWARRGEMILDGQLDPKSSLVIEQSSNIILSTNGSFTRSQLVDPKASE